MNLKALKEILDGKEYQEVWYSPFQNAWIQISPENNYQVEFLANQWTMILLDFTGHFTMFGCGKAGIVTNLPLGEFSKSASPGENEEQFCYVA